MNQDPSRAPNALFLLGFTGMATPDLAPATWRGTIPSSCTSHISDHATIPANMNDMPAR